MRDPYSILGVNKSAGPQEIKAAWRATAKALHPDQNPNDPQAATRFTEAGRAYDLLKDPDKRRLFDDARARHSGGKEKTFMEQRAERARADAEARAAAQARATAEAKARAEARATAQAAAAAQATKSQASKDEDHAAEDVVTKIFGTQKSGETPTSPPPHSDSHVHSNSHAHAEPKTARPAEEPAAATDKSFEKHVEPAQDHRPSPARDLISYVIKRLTGQVPAPEKAPDLNIDVAISIEDVLQRVNPSATLPDGSSLPIKIADDAKDGTQIRIEGQGHRLPNVRRGDVVATLRLKPHRWFRHYGYDLLTYVDIDIENAVLGCEATVETPDGPSKVTIPPWTGSNYKTTLAGKGLPKGHGMRGNLIAEVRVLLWDRPDQKVIDLMRSLREGFYL